MSYQREYRERIAEYFQQEKNNRIKIIRLLRKLLKLKKSEIARENLCVICGCVFNSTKDGAKYCSRACYKKTEIAKSNKRAAKHVRRARQKNVAYEAVDPFEIFDRDGWTCKLCKRSTPREKRGTYEDCAPELDHIVPLSKGGSHVRSNLQCLCRACNENKSDSLLFSFPHP